LTLPVAPPQLLLGEQRIVRLGRRI